MFERFGTFVDAMIDGTMNRLIGAGIDAALTYMRPALALMVVIASVMLMYGKLDFWATVQRGVRAMAIIALLQVGTYQSMIRDTFMVTLPTLAGTATSNGALGTANQAQRFQRLSVAVSTTIATADKKITGWGPEAIRASFSLSFAEMAAKALLTFMFWLSCLARISTALLVCVGPFILIAFLFDTTRGWVISWIGKLVGISIWTLLSDILSEFFVIRSMEWAQTVAANNAAGMFEATDAAWQMALLLLLCCGVLAALPLLAAITGGTATGAVGAAGAFTMAGAARAGSAVMGGASANYRAVKALARR
jgi:type IV secretion system protein VirB6